MGIIETEDGCEIFYRDWGAGPPVVFSHGWPLTGEAWEQPMVFLVQRGYRCIAHDRRGHGRSSQPARGNDMDTYEDDLAALIERLDLRGATLVGHSTGGGEVTRYVGRHGTARVAGVVLVGAIPPLLLRTDANPGGLPIEVFDGLRERVLADRAGFYDEFATPFYGTNRGMTISDGARRAFWLQAMQGGLLGEHACIAAFSESDFRRDLPKLDVPTLFIHGEQDQIVPIEISARAAVRLVPGARLIEYEGAPHGLAVTHQARLCADLLAFLESLQAAPSAGKQKKEAPQPQATR